MADSKQKYEVAFSDLFQFPKIEGASASLRPMEKVLIGHLLMLVRPRIALELGVWQGKTTSFMIDFIHANDLPTQVVGFDMPHIVEELESSPEIMEFQRNGSLRLVPGKLPDSLKVWLDTEKPKVDFVLIDARHDYPSVMSELRSIWQYLSPEGIVICHDYEPGPENQHEGVIYAVHRFAQRHSDAMLISLRSSKDADEFLVDGDKELVYHSVLCMLRKKPYTLSLSNWITHWKTELDWLKPRIGYRLSKLFKRS